MKLRALRVSNVGRFQDPVALEGLSGGLDILCEPNEAGKSTLFRALQAVFFERYAITGQKVEALRPHAGGEPLVEVDFETGTGLWRMSKQFGRRARAQLMDLAPGGATYRNGEADDRLAVLLGAETGKPGRQSLLWLGQGCAIEVEAPDDKRGEARAIQRILEREVASVAGGETLRALHAQVTQLLAQFVTPGQAKPKAHGPLDRALRRRAEVALELAAAEAAAFEAEARLERVAALKAAHAELSAPGARVKAKAALAEARAALATALQARGLLEAGVRDGERAQAAGEQAQRELQDLRVGLASLEALDSDAAAQQPQLEAARADVVRLQAELAQIEARAEAAQTLERQAQDALQGREARQRLARLSATLAQAKPLEDEIAALNPVAATAADEAAFEALLAAEGELERLEAAARASASRVHIAYAPGVIGAITREGATVGDGAEFAVSSQVRLTIAGIGVVTVSPPAASHAAEQLARRTKAEAARIAGLAAFAAPSVAEARVGLAARRAARDALAQARTRLSVLAPDGLAALAAELTMVKAAVGPQGHGQESGEQPPDIAGLRIQIEGFRRDWKTVRSALDAAAAHLAQANAGAQSRHDRRADRLAALPPPDQRAPALEALTERAASARAHVNATLRTIAALKEAAPQRHELVRLRFRPRAIVMRSNCNSSGQVPKTKRLTARASLTAFPRCWTNAPRPTARSRRCKPRRMRSPFFGSCCKRSRPKRAMRPWLPSSNILRHTWIGFSQAPTCGSPKVWSLRALSARPGSRGWVRSVAGLKSRSRCWCGWASRGCLPAPVSPRR
jgi:AAA domain